MANVYSGNTLYFDTAGTLLEGKRVRVSALIITATSANCTVTLVDPLASGDATKLNLSIATNGESQLYDLTAGPILFQNGVKVSTITNGTLTILYNEAAGGS